MFPDRECAVIGAAMNLHTANRRKRRKTRGTVLTYRMGRCPTLFHWTDPPEAMVMFNGYRYYGSGVR
jgi:hypothetical protein